jgi:hypothetical protein
VIKLEPNEEIDGETDGITHPESDDELDPVALNIKRDGSVVEEEDLLCPFHFLEMEIKPENGTWGSAAETTKVQMDSVTHYHKYGVDLKELNGVRELTGNEYVELKCQRGGSRKYCNMSKEEKLAKRREGNRLRNIRYRESMSQEAIERKREQNRLSMRKIRASRKNEETEKRRETYRTYKSSMEEVKLEPDSERHSSHSIIREPGISGAFTEVKPGLSVIKLEPNEEIYG